MTESSEGSKTMNHNRISTLHTLEQRIGHSFKDISLLGTALTHSSFVNENKSMGYSDNERLEFLGDAVLQLCMSEILFERYPDAQEGYLSKMRAALVTEQSLTDVARTYQIGECLLLGKGEDASGGRNKSSILANTFEALIAAVFLDSDYNETINIVRIIFDPFIGHYGTAPLYRDYKSLLQEFSQARFKSIPQYSLVLESGPDHDKTFEIEVRIDTVIKSRGCGKSKKEAEQDAAQKALVTLRTDTGGIES